MRHGRAAQGSYIPGSIRDEEDLASMRVFEKLTFANVHPSGAPVIDLWPHWHQPTSVRRPGMVWPRWDGDR